MEREEEQVGGAEFEEWDAVILQADTALQGKVGGESENHIELGRLHRGGEVQEGGQA
jgi:hypothetical protein